MANGVNPALKHISCQLSTILIFSLCVYLVVASITLLNIIAKQWRNISLIYLPLWPKLHRICHSQHFSLKS